MAQISGTVTLDGTAYAGADIGAINLSADSTEFVTATSTADGTYTIEVTGGADYLVLAQIDTGTEYHRTYSYRAFVESDAVRIIDDFESGDVAEYSGDTGSAVIIQDPDPVWEGANALEIQGHNQGIVSTAGLDHYFPKGEEMHVYVYKAHLDSNARVFVRAADRSNCIAVTLEQWDFFTLRIRDAGLESSLDSAEDPGITTPKWYRVEIELDDGTMGGSDNDIRARLVDPVDDTVLGREIAANSTYQATETGIGFGNWDQNVAGAQSQFDYMYLV